MKTYRLPILNFAFTLKELLFNFVVLMKNFEFKCIYSLNYLC